MDSNSNNKFKMFEFKSNMGFVDFAKRERIGQTHDDKNAEKRN